MEHSEACKAAYEKWKEAWNLSPVPHPKLRLDWESAARKCGCKDRNEASLD